MKRAIFVSVLLVCSSFTFSQVSNGKKSLDKMDYTDKDSVLPRHQLTREQALPIYSLNIELGQQERAFQQRYAASDSLDVSIKKLEKKKICSTRAFYQMINTSFLNKRN